MKIQVPTSWVDVTLRQFTELEKVKDLGFDALDTQLRILSILTGVDDLELLNISYPEFQAINTRINFLESTPPKEKVGIKHKIGDRRYTFGWDAKELTAGEYADIQKYLEGGNDKLHKVLAVYLKPVTILGTRKKGCYKKNVDGVIMQTLESRADTSEYLLDNITMDKVFNMSGFFLSRWKHLIKATQTYLTKEKGKAMKEVEEIMRDKDLLMSTDGI